MFIVKNAWRSVVRNKGRNILIVAIVAIIAAAATIGLSIRDAAQTARDEGLANTEVTATISLDRDKLISEARQNASSDSDDSSDSSGGQPDFDAMRSALDQSSLTLADYQKYAKASSVNVTTYYSEETGVSATDDFQPVETSTSSNASNSSSGTSSDTSTNTDGNQPGGPDGQQGGPGGSMTQGDFTLTGFSSDKAIANARNGSFTMVDGKVFGYDSSSDGQAIISQSLAEFNNLNVGDTITVADPSDSSKTYTLTIVGIYKNSSSENTTAAGPMGGTSQDAANAIYTSVSTLKSLGLDSDTTSSSDSSNATQLNFTYVLGSKDDYETFSNDVKNAGLDDTYTVSSADVEQYESSLVPLDNLAKFALTLLVIVLVVGAVVLIVINLFNIRERKYEVGVLTAIGVKKAKVAAQFAIELLIVTMIGIALGVAGGAAASVPVSNELLAQQVSSQQSEAQSQQEQFGRNADMGGPGGQSAGSNDSGASGTDSSDNDSANGTAANAPGRPGGLTRATNYITTVNATVNFAVVAQMILIGLALTLFSALVGIISVIRYEPLQILADRS
ncbi:ABC transporter permease [Bifidobacterium sp. UTCIF-39]|uniref:FtsX-like permease family protein n=1 Tax=Bifidobacterium sp. UTCIF-39 TaxID=1465359 RepID=UPI00112E7BA1|nr:ABC transporter permease [Bifidobacterium sp. UTCIF-39]TPF96173.1 ABC transporter permease [Bifidobacterium sp. UTCIF-39]